MVTENLHDLAANRAAVALLNALSDALINCECMPSTQLSVLGTLYVNLLTYVVGQAQVSTVLRQTADLIEQATNQQTPQPPLH